MKRCQLTVMHDGDHSSTPVYGVTNAMPRCLEPVTVGLTPQHQAIVDMAHHEADTGAPGGMVAVYVELALRHLDAGHEGYWSQCSACHFALTPSR